MRIIETDDFLDSLSRLPKDIQVFYLRQKKIFVTDPRDSRLHTKKLKDLALVFSFRITRNYRVLFYFQTETIAVFFDIDHRKDVYR